MDWILKAALTAGAVLIVMTAARHGSRRLAGAIAALPTVTAPTLAWLSHEEGLEFAVTAAVGSVAACAMLAAFALCYARAARFRGVAVALACGVGGAMALALPAQMASARLADALPFAIVCCGLALAAMPTACADFAPPRRPAPPTLLVAVAAAGLTALAAGVGPSIGGFATGLLSSLPLITGAVAMAEHAAGGDRAVAGFLRSYMAGLFGKAGFGVVFALLAPRIGMVPALSLACACACLVSGALAGPRFALVGSRADRAAPRSD